jgi:hypothetical protein
VNDSEKSKRYREKKKTEDPSYYAKQYAKEKSRQTEIQRKDKIASITAWKKAHPEKVAEYKRINRARKAALRPPKPLKPHKRTMVEYLAELAARFSAWEQGCQTEEEAYWLGFIVADGNVHRGRLLIGLHARDEGHLNNLQAWLGGGRVNIRESRPGLVVFSVGSIELVRRLAMFDVVPDKHFKTKWPMLLPRCLDRHFIRGVFDGDGCIRRTKKGCWRWNITGNPPLLAAIQNVLVEDCGVKRNKLSSVDKNGVTCRLEYDGNRQVGRIMKYLYQDAAVWLERKRTLWGR